MVGDPARVRQILSNLLSNAVKFSDRGEVRVRCLMTQTADRTHDVTFEVGDTGIGMDGDLMSRIFMPFSQGEAVLQRKNGGTGLGLAIAKKLAELMGGDITVESAPGAGSKFTVKLPAAGRRSEIVQAREA
ncbi:MAG: signal transduction histidine kinase [Maricaulis maris]